MIFLKPLIGLTCHNNRNDKTNIMKKQITKLALFSLIAAALVAVPAASRAEDKPAATPATPAAPAAPAAPAKKHGALPFHGKIAAVDATASTITVGSLTLNITSETKITKDGKPATLTDFAVGDKVGGSYKKDGDKLNATVLHPAKGDKAESKKKKKAE